ncbi:hypothetical protein CR513_41193, partial [Mucuna pruriens]
KIKSLSLDLMNFQIWWIPLDLTIEIIYNGHSIFIPLSKGARTWDDEDSLIMIWLCNSMTSKISQNYMFYFSICDIWENIIEIYSMKKDFAACYDIESKIFNSRQEPS